MAIAHAQQPVPTLGQILTHIEANTEQYKASVPSFLCDEHIVSQEIHDGKIRHETTVEALFRVTRSPSQRGVLEESREVTVDGKPAGNSRLKMPIAFTGGFSGALEKFLSADHRQCFDFAPDPAAPKPKAGTAAFIFTAREAAAKDPSCASIQPGTTGKFVIDSATLQVTHIERTVPYPIGKDRDVLGTASVDFAPVTLSDKSFWLPFMVSASTSETPKTTAFRFTAHYSNYHRFAASSTILPTTSDSSTQPPSR